MYKSIISPMPLRLMTHIFDGSSGSGLISSQMPKLERSFSYLSLVENEESVVFCVASLEPAAEFLVLWVCTNRDESVLFTEFKGLVLAVSMMVLVLVFGRRVPLLIEDINPGDSDALCWLIILFISPTLYLFSSNPLKKL